VGWPIIALGIALLLNAQLGVAPVDVLNTGVVEALDWPFTAGFLLVSVVFFVLGIALGGPVGVGTLLGSVVIGTLIAVFRVPTPEPEALAGRIPLLIVGTVLIAFGVTLAITSGCGPGPIEVFMLGLIRHRVSVLAARWISDGVPLVIGIVLGGSVGVGTVLFGLALGPLIKLFLPMFGGIPQRVTDGTAEYS
jgi:uncharacterized membrane protein YczE